jgi:hypothetical protein
VAFGQKRVYNLWVPFCGNKLDVFERAVHEIFLKLGPESRELAADEVIPSNGLLRGD